MRAREVKACCELWWGRQRGSRGYPQPGAPWGRKGCCLPALRFLLLFPPFASHPKPGSSDTKPLLETSRYRCPVFWDQGKWVPAFTQCPPI